MLGIKKIYTYVLQNFLVLLMMTFLICVFILLMQFVWMHVNDLVGKGVAVTVLAEFFIYASATVVPLALPLAILLASLMTFGNLGEKVELTAMKAAGISLFRIMRPLIVAIGMISVGAFFFSNNVLPAAQTKLWTLIFSLRQKSPELAIPTGEFYKGIPDHQLYVRHKDTKTGLLRDLMIYDFSNGYRDAAVILADSGRIYFTADKKFLKITLYSGEAFENLNDQQKSRNTIGSVPYRRETFSTRSMLIEFDSGFQRYDDSILEDQHVSKNLVQLIHSIDSVSGISDSIAAVQGHELIATHYLNREIQPNEPLTAVDRQTIESHSVDQAIARMTKPRQLATARAAVESARQAADRVSFNRVMLNDTQYYIRRHEIELHRKFTLSFACLIFFFIGAPLGAIIRKGGLGMPTVISVVMFIIYYMIDNTGYKMARDGLWDVFQGMWLSSAILLPIGIFLTYKAATDSAIFNPEAWGKMAEKLLNTFKNIRRHFVRHTETDDPGTR